VNLRHWSLPLRGTESCLQKVCFKVLLERVEVLDEHWCKVVSYKLQKMIEGCMRGHRTWQQFIVYQTLAYHQQYMSVLLSDSFLHFEYTQHLAPDLYRSSELPSSIMSGV